ncbi:Oidioi.mRNA.OKI2018_I69.XSR.g13345.t1.cds [Oikopleura dioica]|uniref:Oidioi.mRNA.OKI2018_I69.XSR.g13345.t1.cds n=1 Tax=Oikopleura dioica TaxID=34765 RepID=A0ABN7SAB7_OIKDI|nr:Oidioi.mRNA.OKI2018_I69.XSR.g13345.t1.cds [Oikopleura dioica]
MTHLLGNSSARFGTFLQRLISKLQEGSRQLFEVTEGRTFIRDAVIVVPSHWKEPEREELDITGISFDGETSNKHFGSADMQVFSSGREGGSLIYTVKTSPCEQRGRSIRVSESYLNNDEENFGGDFVAQFAKLRFGVFDETPISPKHEFYFDSDRKIQATKCSADIQEGLLSGTFHRL